MLSRVGAVAITQARYQRRALFATTMAAAGGVLTYSSNTSPWTTTITDCDGSSKLATATSLVVPTLEAGIRAFRLVQTATMMVLSYQYTFKISPYFETKADRDETKEHDYWQSEVERREELLEACQIRYAREHFDDMEEMRLTPAEKRQKKLEQKAEMQKAAMNLAEAEEKLNSIEGESPKSKLHRKEAQRLLELCHTNGGVYIKIGQHLANLDYLIPPEYIEVLSGLFNDNPQTKYEDVRRVVEEEMGNPIEEVYDNFDPEPIASASLAQVHVAYEKGTGKKLAVKVQHAGLRETSKGDLFAVTTVVNIIDTLFEDFTFGWIADEITPHLPKELDFVREGKNAERAAANLEGSGLACVIPRIIWDKTSSRLLTMEFEEGFKATDMKSLEKEGLNKQ
jgi:hypothetical protein